MDLTDEEYEKIIQELANRWKNLAYINAETAIKREVSKDILEEVLDKNVDYEITFSLRTVVTDLREIIGGIRRVQNHDRNPDDRQESTVGYA